MTAERVRHVLEASLPWGILGVMTAAVLGVNVSEGIRHLVTQNGAVLLLVAICAQYAPNAIEALRSQASATTDLAASVRETTRRDDLKHEKIQIGIQMILDRFDGLRCRYQPCPLTENLGVGATHASPVQNTEPRDGDT
jgi:hypothetical protein